MESASRQRLAERDFALSDKLYLNQAARRFRFQPYFSSVRFHEGTRIQSQKHFLMVRFRKTAFWRWASWFKLNKGFLHLSGSLIFGQRKQHWQRSTLLHRKKNYMSFSEHFNCHSLTSYLWSQRNTGILNESLHGHQRIFGDLCMRSDTKTLMEQ